ncbi:MAG: SusC/RagA family TonB-linked outer membrane protein [Duncaniella sp.]|uniref:SusC/RagA family TonB-linked outer membrane protein n=1 Tax=Duncaniella sp. TaxID=2518496 RepID=UPI0023C85C8C|nr:SusC/RagA family TonB-linked outer membrane protein [Duncaniella sp.]MDE5988712.1 SusC/RagA family TonB-linked outer membrane protein [Duncaniella sp.]
MKRRLLTVLVGGLFMPAALFAANYDLTFNGDSPEAAFEAIKKATGYEFVYNKGILSGSAGRSITGSYHDMDLRQILNHVVGEQLGLGYEIVDKSIILSKQVGQKASKVKVSGRVTDSNGEPLPGASVWLKKSSKVATATDIDGEFSLPSNGQTNAVIVVSYIGMKRKEVNWTGKPLNIVLEDDNSNELDGVVVTGYQVIDKRASTSAITSIKAEDILRADALSIDQMLEGQIPDMMYVSNSGEAGVAPKIRIRGTSSIIGNREPLWVVDGIVVNDPVEISAEDLNDPDYVNRIGNAIAGLNPQDIERLDVLKDASATALYGTKAANGVIVITTKRGKEGKPTIRYNNNFTWKLRPRYTDSSVDVMSSKERIQLSRELFADHYRYNNNAPVVGYEALMQQLYEGKITEAQLSSKIAALEVLNTDWFDLLTHDSFSQQHTVSLSGGGERGTYYASLGYVDNDDVVKGTTNKRYSAVVNLDVNFAKWLTGSFGVKGNVSDREYYQESISPVEYAYSTSRAIPAYDENGEYYYYGKYKSYTTPNNFNILNELENSSVKQDQSSFTFDANLKFRFTDWLTANAILSYTSAATDIESYWGDHTWYAADLRGCEYGETPGSSSLMPQGGELSKSNTRQRSWTARVQLDWNKYFDDEIHNFSGGVGFEASQNRYKGYSRVDRGYFPDRGMMFVSNINLDNYTDYAAWLASNVPSLTDSKSNIISAYATASYNWRRMIFLNANMRIDGSNNFGDRSNDKILPVWSVSGSFDAAQLDFIRQQTWLDQLTIKGSYGFQGNMLSNQYPVMIIQKNPMDDYFGEFTSSVVSNPNPDLKWEKTTSVNFGWVLGMFNNRLQIEGDFYWKHTKDAFMTKSISTINGYSSYVVNGGNIQNNGYSIGITGRPIQTRDWQWSISTSFSRVTNSVQTLPAGESYQLSDFLNGSAIVKGKSVGTFYSYRFIGLNPLDGGPMFDDWHDHYIDLAGLNKYDTYTKVLVASGSREPFMSGSLSTRLRWKRLYASATFAYSLGAKTRLFGMYSGVGSTSGDGSSGVYMSAAEIWPSNNLSRDYLKRWMMPGDELHTNIPAIIGNGHPSYFNYSDHWSTTGAASDLGIQRIADNAWDMYDYSNVRVVSANYLKLSTVSLSYELPERWIAKFGLSRLELHASGNNLHTWCDSKLKGQTPTQGGFTTIQLSDRPSYSFGLNVSF